jgi:hypothetical protein
MERWETIPFFSSYKVSTLGRIRKRNTHYFLSLNTIRCNYIRLSIINDAKKSKNMTLHRLVAITFLPNPENKATVNHKDHDPLNNRLTNLEWSTVKEQNTHKRKVHETKSKFISARNVIRIDPITNKVLQEYISIREAAKWIFDEKYTRVSTFNKGENIKTKICAVCRGKRKTAYTFVWKYLNDNDDDDCEWYPIPSILINDVRGYFISKSGKIKNKTGRVSHGFHEPNEYVWVSVSPKTYLLHVLMAKVFLSNPEKKQYVNHKDGDKTNAKLENLEWCTPTENCYHYHHYLKNKVL